MKTGAVGYEGTPLDGKTTMRKISRKRSRRKKKASKKDRRRRRSPSGSSRSGNGNSTGGSSSSGGTIASEDSGHPFREGHRVKQLGKRIPGILMRRALDEMNRLLVQHVGEESTETIKPILLRCLRLHVMAKSVVPAQKRELLTLGYAIDQLLQRNILGALDIMVQRVKAIELVLNGATWAVAQNIELVPLEQEVIASVAEAQGAAREFRHDSRVQREMAGKGPGKWRWTDEGKGKKGEGKKGEGKGGKRGRKERSGTDKCSPSRPRDTPMNTKSNPADEGSMGPCPDDGGNQWDRFLSKDLGLFIMEVLLGRSDCGFSSLVQSFCEGKGETMARGEREQKTSIFPLPLPSNTSVKKAVEKRDGLFLWFFLLVCALNYLNGGVHVRMGTFEANAIQQEILDYLKSQVDIYQEHEFEIGRFDWGKFLQTRTISYTNEEVRAAQWTSWSQVQPALPYGAIGSVRAVDYAEDGVLDLLLNPAQYLQSTWDHQPVRASRVMVTEENWAELAEGLVKYTVCLVIPASAVAKCGGSLLQNGLFGIEKNEQVNGIEVHRLIMNLVPFNSVSMHVSGDVATLPLLQQLASLHLQPEEELVVSSKDVRCMFYIYQLPAAWLPFLSFGKKAPPQIVPPHVHEDCYLCAKVLPMGYLNSVGIAQHLHRNFMKKVQGEPGRLGPFSEVRKDRSWPLSNPCWRIYLDNLDVLEKTNPALCRVLEGETSPDLAHIIQAYETAGIPLHAKKSVQQATTAEMQGAEIDGVQGLGQPRKEKLGKSVSAVLSLIRRARCSQKEIQVVGGGLVYFAMFRRPLMSCLNFIWGFMQSFEDGGPRVRAIPGAVLSELLMFISLLPLAHMDFRLNISPTVTASDASLLGGGVCASDQVTSYGEQVAEGSFRGEIQQEVPDGGIVCIGLFDGISSQP